MEQPITAPLAGKVLRLSISVGDQIAEDEETVVIEALKMETVVFAPCGGTIKSIKVKEGDAVEEDDVLAVIDGE